MADRATINRIDGLIERYLEIVASPGNQENRKLWEPAEHWNRDMWRGLPRQGLAQLPTTIAPDNSLMSKLMGVSLTDYYGDPYVYMETQLRFKVFCAENFRDNTVYTNELFLWFGVVTELSMFGAQIEFYPYKEAWITGHALDDYAGIASHDPVDFYNSGLMPRVHRFYEVMRELSKDRLHVMFPEFVRGPFCIAMHLLGYERMVNDAFAEPEMFAGLMRYIVDCNKHWSAERARFTGETQDGCKLYNDEVDCPSISPNFYAETIFPYEKELSEHFGSVKYWHSCGNITRFLPQLAQLPNLRMVHCGPWTSYQEANRIFAGTGTTIDICLNPTTDVLDADEMRMAEKLTDIKTRMTDVPTAVRADAFMPYGDVDVVGRLEKWSLVAQRAL